jgi:hypothetical protein
VGGALVCAVLVGCVPIDYQSPVAYLYNEWDSGVTLTLIGVEEPQAVPARESHVIRGPDGDRLYGEDDCYGDGFVLTETASGREIARTDEPVCGGTIITVTEDGELKGRP